MEVDVVATVISLDAAAAPLSGERAAVVVVEALNAFEILGTMVLGDLLRVRWEAGEAEIAARRATWSFTSMYEPSALPARVPAELVPWLQRGATSFRERLVRGGDRLRVRGRLQSASPGARFFVAPGEIRLDELLAWSSSLY